MLVCFFLFIMIIGNVGIFVNFIIFVGVGMVSLVKFECV